MTKISEYLKSPNGKPSSTRWFSSLFMWYFFIINVIIMLLVFFGNTVLDINTIMFITLHDFFILLAIFAPKQLGKIEEMKEFVSSLPFNNPSDTETDNKPSE